MARLRNLRDTLQAAERMARLPMSVENKLREKLKEEGADFFRFDAAADLVIVLDPSSTDSEPKFIGAISIPLADIEQARAAFERDGHEVSPLIPGVYRTVFEDKDAEKSVEPESESEQDDQDIEPELPDRSHCDLAVSVGDAPARLVCSDDVSDLNALRPWMTRGMPSMSLTEADLYAEVRFAPLRDRYLPVARAQVPSMDLLAKAWLESELGIREPRLLAVPGQLMEEGMAIVDDLDRLSMIVDLDANASEMAIKAKVSFRGKTAWLTKVNTDANDEAGPAPEMFWRLPRDADSATYARSADPDLYEGVRETLRLLTSHLLTQTPLSAGSKSAIEGFVATMPIHKATVVSARGVVGLRDLNSAKKATPTPRDAVRELETLVNASFGWSVVGVDAPAKPYADWFASAATAYERVLRDARNDKDMGPDIRKAGWIPTVQVRNFVAGYPRGTTGIDVTSRFDSRDIWAFTAGKDEGAPEHPAGPAVKGTITLRIVVVPDGASRTWIGMSADTKLLQEKLRVVMAGKRESTIASLPGLESLRNTPAVGAGFFTYGNLIDQTLETLKKEGEVDDATAARLMATMPNRLQTPFLMFHTGTAGAAPGNEVELRVQRGTMEDIAGIVSFALSPQGQKLFESLGEKEEKSPTN